MSIVPIDIIKKEFPLKIRGYDSAEVDGFLKDVSEQYEKALVENARLNEELRVLRTELERYRKIESTMNNALVLAQQTADDLRSSARKEAELTIREARESLEHELAGLQSECQELRQARCRFAAEFRAMLSGYMDTCKALDNGGSPHQYSDE